MNLPRRQTDLAFGRIPPGGGLQEDGVIRSGIEARSLSKGTTMNIRRSLSALVLAGALAGGGVALSPGVADAATVTYAPRVVRQQMNDCRSQLASIEIYRERSATAHASYNLTQAYTYDMIISLLVRGYYAEGCDRFFGPQ